MSGIADSSANEPLPPRRSRSLRRPRGGGILIAAVSTIVVFAGLGYVLVNAPGWARVQESFFDAEIFADAFPEVAQAFLVNVRIFLTAEALILVVALLLAVMRSLPGPVFFPFRLMAVIYIDFFRGVPGLLVIYLLGLGIPALRLPGVTNDVLFWGLVGLVLVWSAYVAEVYRSGIDSIHPSQEAAARSLGLSRFQSLRFVVLPQAVRRVIPPLLNDFIGLQKDTALLSLLGIVEAFRRAQIAASAAFDFTPYLITALFFLVLTVPLARLTDWLVERDRRKRYAQVGAR
ncbi:MAG: amino acid ABC transporter permease [Chloroflexi bacterium]|jgi:polar amino acid transport system permease protein|nr:amino acid ABC transporter permease [Chloroflexota bacterium]